MVRRQVILVALALLSMAAALIALQVTPAGAPPVAQAQPAAQDSVLVETVGPATVDASSTVEYLIQADGVVDLAGAQFTFTYDPTLFTLDSVVLGPDLGGCNPIINDATPGTLIPGLICLQGNTGAPLTLWAVMLTAAQVQQDQQTELAVTDVTLGDIDV